MSAAEIPVITVEEVSYVQIGGSQEYRLMATSYGRTAWAGPHLFRAPPHPDIRFGHDHKEDALKDAEKLTQYLNDLGKKQPSKAKLRKQTA